MNEVSELPSIIPLQEQLNNRAIKPASRVCSACNGTRRDAKSGGKCPACQGEAARVPLRIKAA